MMRLAIVWFFAAASLLLLGGAPADERSRPSGPSERASYSLGHQIGRDLARQGSAVDTEALRKGLMDGLSGAGPALDLQELRELLAALKRRVKAADRSRDREESRERIEAGREYLERNAARPGVVSLESGLQYEVLQRGRGNSPGPDDRVLVHYRGTTMDGKVFHDSRVHPDRPETLHVRGVVRGLTEALQLMKPGDLWKITLPPDLAYGRRGPLADHAVIFELELIAVLEEEPGEAGP